MQAKNETVENSIKNYFLPDKNLLSLRFHFSGLSLVKIKAIDLIHNFNYSTNERMQIEFKDKVSYGNFF